MPRGVKKQINYQKEIEKIDDELQCLEEKQNLLNKKRKDLVKAEREEQMNSLYNVISQNGLTIEDVIELIQPKPEHKSNPEPKPQTTKSEYENKSEVKHESELEQPIKPLINSIKSA